MGNTYAGKIDGTHDQTSHKYRQVYSMLRHLTRKDPFASAQATKTPGKLNSQEDDELNQSATKSTAQK